MQEGGGTIKWIKDREDGVGPAGGSARERPRARSLRAAARARGCSPAPTSPPSPSHRPTGRQAGARGGGRVGGSGWRGRATERLPKKRGRGAVPDPVDALLRLRPGPTSGAGGARPRPHTRQGPSLGGWAADGRERTGMAARAGRTRGRVCRGEQHPKKPVPRSFFSRSPWAGLAFPPRATASDAPAHPVNRPDDARTLRAETAEVRAVRARAEAMVFWGGGEVLFGWRRTELWGEGWSKKMMKSSFFLSRQKKTHPLAPPLLRNGLRPLRHPRRRCGRPPGASGVAMTGAKREWGTGGARAGEGRRASEAKKKKGRPPPSLSTRPGGCKPFSPFGCAPPSRTPPAGPGARWPAHQGHLQSLHHLLAR